MRISFYKESINNSSIIQKYFDVSGVDENEFIDNELLSNSILDIYDSFEIGDEDLINDNILHLSRLFKNKNFPEIFKNLVDLRALLLCLLNFENGSLISKTFLEMIAFLSFTNYFSSIKVMDECQFYNYILNSAYQFHDFNGFIILSNFSLDSEENAKKLYLSFHPKFISEEFIRNNNHKVKLGLILILFSYCNYQHNDESLKDIIISLTKCLQYSNADKDIINEIFHSLSSLKIKNDNFIPIACELHILTIFESLNDDLSFPIIITIFQIYGESIIYCSENQNLNINIKLNLNRLILYAKCTNESLSVTSLWLLWTYLTYFPHEVKLLYDQTFISLLNDFIQDSTSDIYKYTILIYTLLIEQSNSQEMNFLTTRIPYDRLFDAFYIDDEQLIINLIIALDKLLFYYDSIGDESFYNNLQLKCHDIPLCSLPNDITHHYSRIFACFNPNANP